MLCSVLLLDSDGVHLRHGAAPSLPQAYCKAIDGLEIGPAAGSCGTAAYRMAPVVVTDIDTDPLWQDYRELALEHGLRACWSTPLFAAAGSVLGTLAMYYREPRSPAPADLDLIARGAHLIAIAVERDRASHALNASEARFRSIVETAEEGVWQTDENAVATFVNRKLGDIFGYAPEEMIGRTIYEFMHESDIPAARAIQQRRREGVCEQVEFRYRHRDGREIWTRIASAPEFDAQGRFAGALGMLSDITERRRAEQDLRLAHERLQTLSRRLLVVQEQERAALARELHDEIGQALTALKLNLQAVARVVTGALAPTLESSVAIVDGALSQVRRLSLDLHPPLLDDLGLAAALQAHVRRAFSSDQAPKVALNIPRDLPVLAPEAAVACFRIVQEAMNNAARHAQARSIDVVFTRRDGRLDLEIADDGRGFDFQQARDAARAGHSMGLASMEERARLLGGSFSIESRAGAGTNVHVSIPLDSAAAAP